MESEITMIHGTIRLGEPSTAPAQIDYKITPEGLVLGISVPDSCSTSTVTAADARAFHTEITKKLSQAGIIADHLDSLEEELAFLITDWLAASRDTQDPSLNLLEQACARKAANECRAAIITLICPN